MDATEEEGAGLKKSEMERWTLRFPFADEEVLPGGGMGEY